MPGSGTELPPPLPEPEPPGAGHMPGIRWQVTPAWAIGVPRATMAEASRLNAILRTVAPTWLVNPMQGSRHVR